MVRAEGGWTIMVGGELGSCESSVFLMYIKVSRTDYYGFACCRYDVVRFKVPGGEGNTGLEVVYRHGAELGGGKREGETKLVAKREASKA